MVSKKVNFITTGKGFKVQEIYEVKELRGYDPNSDFPQTLKDIMTEDYEIKPDAGKSFIIRAQAIIDVDFSNKLLDPVLTVESNFIDYGSKALESILDTRSILQIISDFFNNLFGKNVVTDWSETVNMSDNSMGMAP